MCVCGDLLRANDEGHRSYIDAITTADGGGSAELTGEETAGGIEVHTVDKYQGRDKHCILLSFVRSNPDAQVRSAGRVPPSVSHRCCCPRAL